MNPAIRRALISIIGSAPADRSAWLKASTQRSGIHRQIFSEFKTHLDVFRGGSAANQWLILPGLRGVGKTTILTQLYLDLPSETPCRFFLSLERAKLLGAEMRDVLSVIEELAGDSLETSKHPIYIFMDEVQYLKDWALGLKTVFDRAAKVFIVCTGSSAIDLQSNPDVARRSQKIPIRPLDFAEYMNFRSHYHRQAEPEYPDESLRQALGRALLHSKDCRDVFLKLQGVREEVEAYWSGIDKSACLDDYIRFGSLPFTFQIADDSSKWRAIDALLSESLAKDVSRFAHKRDSATEAFPILMRLLAESDAISLQRIAKTISLNQRTVLSMLQTLCSTELLNPIRPLGAAYRQVNRPSKYLFTTPAMRLALAMKAGLTVPEATLKGRLLEDIAGLYLKRISPFGLCYDGKPGGADFIIPGSKKEAAIPIEVGWQKRDSKQTKQTLQRVKGKYGLVVTNCVLNIDPESESVFVPLEYFLLL